MRPKRHFRFNKELDHSVSPTDFYNPIVPFHFLSHLNRKIPNVCCYTVIRNYRMLVRLSEILFLKTLVLAKPFFLLQACSINNNDIDRLSKFLSFFSYIWTISWTKTNSLCDPVRTRDPVKFGEKCSSRLKDKVRFGRSFKMGINFLLAVWFVRSSNSLLANSKRCQTSCSELFERSPMQNDAINRPY